MVNAREVAIWVLPNGETLALGVLDRLSETDRKATLSAFTARVESAREAFDLKTTVVRKRQRLCVSTVYLGVNVSHSFAAGASMAILWETMIFDESSGALDYQWRYGSERAAIEGHRTIVRALGGWRAKRTPPSL